MSFLTKSFIINIALIIIAMIASYHAARMVRGAIILRTQSAEMTKKIEELRQKKEELESELARMQTQEAIEREAKERFNMKKSGEEVVVVVPKKKNDNTAASPSTLWDTAWNIIRETITSFVQYQ